MQGYSLQQCLARSKEMQDQAKGGKGQLPPWQQPPAAWQQPPIKQETEAASGISPRQVATELRHAQHSEALAKATQKREAPAEAETSPAKQTKIEDHTIAAAQANIRLQTYLAMHPEAVSGAGSGSAAPQAAPATPVTGGETNANIAAGIRQLMSQ